MRSRIDTAFYYYMDACNKPIHKKIKIGNSDKIFENYYELDSSCCIVEDLEEGRGETNKTRREYDGKGRLIKREFSYKKSNKVETFEYDDINLTCKYLEFSPIYNVSRDKEPIKFNADKEIIEYQYYYKPTWAKSYFQ